MSPLSVLDWMLARHRCRAGTAGDAAVLDTATIGLDRRRQADAFWWNGQSDHALAALTRGDDAGWKGLPRLVRGAGPGEAADDGRVLTVTRQVPALVALDGRGALLERIEP
ncbi:MAG: hypothetical protein GEV13_21485 [Rhodospirillales bacterium]|nr:hypothetical protein [Rhodospirillales bacterium]